MNPGFRQRRDAGLRSRNTFGIGARAPLLLEIDDPAALPLALALPEVSAGPVLVLGGGSNLLFAADPAGTVLALRNQRIALHSEQGDSVVVRADAGLDWHACVQWTLAQGLCGLENLSLIPGTVGAAPIQNIGAYGVEVRDRIHAVEAWDRETAMPVRLNPDDCAFAYRDSRFKREPDRWIVLAVEFALSRTPSLHLDYAGIAAELESMGIDTPGAKQVSEAVTRIRRRKLPDPAAIGNAGSFFKNPVVPATHADALLGDHPGLPVFPVAPFPADAALHDASGVTGLRKLSAAWLIDACGWKGHRDGDAGVSADHALVLVNHGSASGRQLLDLARRIAASVEARFGVALEPEPRIIGADW
ncbi:UDP-N-acetylmuramate dehydrogenase [Luteimonas vadosa]|uniref:UDP-N-acetylenolpyruvoylglucosamine reductase n=1 Tax=Luteimonas vadosa TaxID=1165507 RepID=A0ABP9E488_9GAMM